MSIPPHYINIYQRPKQGANFLKRYQAYNYQHSISAMGWFDTASCDISVRGYAEGQDLINTMLGAYVKIIVDNPIVPCWEGLINRITYNAGGSTYTISLEEMANRVSCVYTGAANAAAETAIVNNVNSQAVYGIKQEQIEFGPDATAATQRAVLTNTLLAQKAWPLTSRSQPMGQANTVHLELIGIFHTIEWSKYFTTAAAAVAFGTQVAAVVPTDTNGTTFYNSADVSQISANAATVTQQVRGQSYWEYLMKIAEAGDGTNYWIVGVGPTNPTTHTRVFYYRAFNTVVTYVAFQSDNLKPRNAFGKPVPPWLVVPDTVIRVNDVLVGFVNTGTFDPRLTWISNIQYDANSQSVQWFGTDDTTARALFGLKRSFRPLSKNSPGSAPLRTIVT